MDDQPRSKSTPAAAKVLWAGLAAAAIWCAAPAKVAAAEPKILNILAWSDYFDARSLEDFASSTGIRIVYDTYPAREIVETRLRGATEYDVVVLPGPTLRTLIAAGALRKLDRAKIDNAGNLWPDITMRLAAFDPGNQYAVPYLWSTIGLAFDVDKASAKPAAGQSELASLETLFNPDRIAAFAECGVFVPDSPDDLFALALRRLRLDPGSKNQTDLRRAAELLAGMRRYVRKFGSGDTAGALANGDICLALIGSGDGLQARARAKATDNGVDIGYVIPKEGTVMEIDALAVPKNAPHAEAAFAFINFLLRPEVAARNTNATRLANSVAASKPLIAKDIANNAAIYPDAALMSRLFTSPNLDPAAQKIVSREWTRVKTGK
jgi:putrescine transport system substrate-binding protein